jgi:putative CocE/NonD family hydrolase
MLVYHSIEANNPGTVNTIVEGPWVHGGWARNDGDHLGDVTFNAKTSEYFRKNIQFPFFEKYLKDKGEAMPEAYMFETGTNVWRKYDSWPPVQAKAQTLYFHAGGKLSFEPPAANEGSDSYVSDPAHPVPYVGYVTDTVPQRYMVDDQRFAATRPDVLVYETEPLTEDVTIAGPISPKLKVATTGTDSDFVVKLIDVYPNDYPSPEPAAPVGKHVVDTPALQMGGYQELLRGEPMRGKFRNSWEKPEAFVPGRMADVDFTMPDLDHTFRKGHRIMGAGAELLVPADRPQSADLHRYSEREAFRLQSRDRDDLSLGRSRIGRRSAGDAAALDDLERNTFAAIHMCGSPHCLLRYAPILPSPIPMT